MHISVLAGAILGVVPTKVGLVRLGLVRLLGLV